MATRREVVGLLMHEPDSELTGEKLRIHLAQWIVGNRNQLRRLDVLKPMIDQVDPLPSRNWRHRPKGDFTIRGLNRSVMQRARDMGYQADNIHELVRVFQRELSESGDPEVVLLTTDPDE